MESVSKAMFIQEFGFKKEGKMRQLLKGNVRSRQYIYIYIFVNKRCYRIFCYYIYRICSKNDTLEKQNDG